VWFGDNGGLAVTSRVTRECSSDAESNWEEMVAKQSDIDPGLLILA